MSGPLPISIVVATWNRRADLLQTLTLLRLREPVAEILVVDNGSSDGTAAQVCTDFPEARVIRLTHNHGVPAFGIGVTAATQPFVLLLDDDATPAQGTLTRVVEVLSGAPATAVAACRILNAKGVDVTRGWPAHPLCFWGCGSALRRDALSNQPYCFDPRLFLHGTEMDLAIRLYAEGYRVNFVPDAIVHHRFSEANRLSARRMFFLAQSAAWFPLKHFPTRYAVPAVTRHLAVLLFRAVRGGTLGAFLRGVARAIWQAPVVIKERRPVSLQLARIYYENIWEYEPLLLRLRRAVLGRPPARRDTPQGFPDLAPEGAK